MNELTTEMLEQLVYLGADFQLSYEKDKERPWSLSVRCGGMKPLDVVCLTEDLAWSATFAVNTVISETRADEGIPLHNMP